MIKVISITVLAIYFLLVVVIALASQTYALFIFLIFWVNVIFIWFVGRMVARLMLLPNSNWLVANIMNRTLYKKVTQELVKLLKYIGNVLEHMKDGRSFETEREFEKYAQDLSKGVEMLNLLLEANLYYKKMKNGRVKPFFNEVTDRMFKIRETLKSIQVFVPNEQDEDVISNFFDYDFSFPVFDRQFHPILPEFIDTPKNKATVSEAKAQLNEFNDL